MFTLFGAPDGAFYLKEDGNANPWNVAPTPGHFDADCTALSQGTPPLSTITVVPASQFADTYTPLATWYGPGAFEISAGLSEQTHTLIKHYLGGTAASEPDPADPDDDDDETEDPTAPDAVEVKENTTELPSTDLTPVGA
jgi:hypothetical protein